MKQKLLYIILFIFTLLAWSSQVVAQTTSYVLNVASEQKLNTIQTGSSMSLSGPGATLTFDAKGSSSLTGAGVKYFHVEKSTNGGSNWERIASNVGLSTSYQTFTYNIGTNVTHIRFLTTTGSTYTKYYKNVKITRATTLAVSSSSPALSFGNVHRGNNKTINAKVDWNNTTYNQNLTGSGPTGYSVTTTSMGEYGTGKEIPVKFTASNSTALGANNGNVTLTMAGKSVTIAATANVVTTYYGKATAAASAGGSAYVSFTSYDAATTTNATTNTANTSNASESKTAYYKATVNTGYVFLGWIKGTASYSANNVVSTSLTYNPTITYSSETSGSPTETTYKAWFAPMFYFSANATSSNGSLGSASASITEEVQGAPGETSKTATATFTATPETGCTFNGWYETSDYSGSPVSTNTTYTRTLTDNNVSSTTPVSLTLYAWFRKNPNLQWADPSLDLNLVKGTTSSSPATAVDDGIAITYTSSNTDAVTVDADGTVHAIDLGQSTIKARVASTFTYNADSISREFTVADKKQATFTPAWGEGTTADIKVGASTKIVLTNIATDATFRVSTKHGTDTIRWEREVDTLIIHGYAAGKDTITLEQDGNNFLYGNTASYIITVSKYANPFALDAESKAMKVGETWTGVITNRGNRNAPQVSYSVAGIATYDAANNRITANAEGSTVITFTQASTDDTLGITRSINVSVTKVENTLSVMLPSLTAEVGGTITANITGRNNMSTDIVATITTDSISPIKDTNYGVITYANGVITARNAGRARIRFLQAATTQYTGYESEEYEVEVSKIANSITLTLAGGSTTNIKLKYNATASLSYTSTNGDTSPVVTRVSGNYTSYSSGTITAGSSQGTDIYEITQAETYKYEAGFASFTIRVNNTDEAVGYVLDDATQYSHGTGAGVVHTYTLSGPGETLYYTARTQWAAIYYNLYVEYSTDNENWVEAQDNQSLSSSDKDFSCAIPEDARYVRFRFPAGGTLTKYIKNVKVSRKTYVRASSDITELGTLYTDQTRTATITVNYSSTNGGNIGISTNNSNFALSTTSLTAANNSDGTKTFTVTYTPDPDHLGAESAVITIADLFYTEQITLNATSQKYATTIARGSNDATATTVEGTIANAFAFTGTTTATPSDDSDDDFYYSISHTQTSSVNNGDGVISYNPATNTVTGLNQGTARLTIYQKKTNLYHATSQTFDFSVTKLANNVTIALSTSTLNVDGSATVQLTNDNSDGVLSAEYSNISYTNEAQNREGGLLSFTAGTKTLTGVNAGTGKVTIMQAETYKYVAKSAEFNVTVNKLSQTLTWDDPDLETGMQRGSTLEGNTATSDAGLTPVTYTSSNTAAITVNATTGVLTAVAVGSNITITASQAGNYKYLPATVTRVFSVFNKQVPAFVPDAHFAGANGRVEQTCVAIITVTGVSDEDDFTITNGDNTVIDVMRDGETITITGLALGSTTLTLAQEGNEDYIARSQTYNIEVYWPDDFLTLSSDEAPDYDAGEYRKIFFNRTLKAGYSTIALPFDTDVETIVGDSYDEDKDWVAQLSAVTSSVADGYTLYFQKVADGAIEANNPYVLHLASAKVNPTWVNMEDGISVDEASPASIHPTKGYSGYAGWTMTANYTPDFAMDGKYGVVNSEGGLMLGSGSGAKLNAFTAYITAPSGPSNAPRLRVAYVDEDGTTTYIDSLFEGQQEKAPEAIYGPDGQRRAKMQRGVNIVRYSDGTTRKVYQ